jgi:hypothetical protein
LNPWAQWQIKERGEIVRRGKNEQFIGNWDVANTCNMHQYVQVNYGISHASDNSDKRLLCVMSQCQCCKSEMFVMKWEQWPRKKLVHSFPRNGRDWQKSFPFKAPKQKNCSLMRIAAP